MKDLAFLTPNAQQIEEAREYNLLLFKVFSKLSTIVFIGRKSQREILFYSGHTPHRLLAAHHPAAQSMTVSQCWIENVAVFKRLNAPEYGIPASCLRATDWWTPHKMLKINCEILSIDASTPPTSTPKSPPSPDR